MTYSENTDGSGTLMLCSHCGSRLIDGAKYCAYCGSLIEDNQRSAIDGSIPERTSTKQNENVVLQRLVNSIDNGLFNGVSISKFDLNTNFDSFRTITLDCNISMWNSNKLCPVTLSLSKDELVIHDYSGKVVYTVILDDFFMLDLKEGNVNPIVYYHSKQHPHMLEFNLKANNFTLINKLEIYYINKCDKDSIIQALKYYNHCKIWHLYELYEKALSLKEKCMEDTALLRYIRKYLSDRNQYITCSFYRWLGTENILETQSRYRRFIYECLVPEKIDKKTINNGRYSTINCILGAEIKDTEMFLSSYYGNSCITDLVNLFQAKIREDRIVAKFMVYFMIENELLRNEAKFCKFFNVFESINNDVNFTPKEVIDCYLLRNPNNNDRRQLRNLLACLILYNVYKCSPDKAVECFWIEAKQCREAIEIVDLLPKNDTVDNRFSKILLQEENRKIEKANDFVFDLVDIDAKNEIQRICDKMNNMPIFQAFDSFIQMIPENIKENVVVFSIFILEYLNKWCAENGNTDIYNALASCNNQLPQYRGHILSADLYQKLGMLSVLLQKQFSECIGYEGFAIVSGINRALILKVQKKVNALKENDDESQNIENRITTMVLKGLLNPSNMNSTTIFIYSLYYKKQLNSFLQLPLYNQYKYIFDLVQNEYNNLAQSDFERQLLFYNSNSIQEYTIDTIDMMNGIEFESFVAKLFHAMGYSTSITQASNDQGIDVIAEKMSLEGNERIGIQAKCYSGSVGNSAIQEVVAGMAYYKLNKAIVVTNNFFTKGAIKLASANNVILWDRNILSSKLNILN